MSSVLAWACPTAQGTGYLHMSVIPGDLTHFLKRQSATSGQGRVQNLGPSVSTYYGGTVTARRRWPLPREGGGEWRLHPRRVWGPWLGHGEHPGKPPTEGPKLVTYGCRTNYGSLSATAAHCPLGSR